MLNTVIEANALPTFLYVANKNELRYHYVGCERAEIFSQRGNFVPDGISASWPDFKDAIDRWQDIETAPEVVFIDLPVDSKVLVDLNELIVRNHLDLRTVFIYNKAQVIVNQSTIESQRKQLSEIFFLDDSIDFDDLQENLFDVVTFLRKFKSNYVSNTFQPKVSSHLERITHVDTGLKLKRAFDVLFALVLIVALSPLLLLIAIGIKLDSRGPVFYSAPRAGRRFKVFNFYKFRTMVIDADRKVEALRDLNQYDAAQAGPKFFKIANDPRVTRLGKFLRNTSLDELPQLFNVLKGDMSIIGNRPLPLYEAETLTTDEYIERFTAPAGITGLWQIKKRGNENMSVEERIGLDIAYSRNLNFVNDLRILVKTPMSMVQKANV